MNPAERSELSHALRDAVAGDIRFEEEPLAVHSGDASAKVGCRPVSVRGVRVPRPGLVVYVRATDDRGEYWYVLDWSKSTSGGRHEEVAVESEQDAMEAVLTRLRAAAEAGLL